MMDLKIRPMTPEERKYTYDQSNQLNIQTQCVGHLRIDFSEDENTFYRSWTDHVWTLNTDEFRKELDDVINALRFDERYGGILKDRRSFSVYCLATPKISFGDGNYGFRIDAGEHAYMCRLDLKQGEYNLYCYCYISRWLDQHIQEARQGIRFVSSRYKELFRIPDGEKVRIQLADGTTLDRMCRYIDETHVEVGNSLYHIAEFAEKMEYARNTIIPLRSSLPQRCFEFIEKSGEIGVVVKGINGYIKSDFSTADRKYNKGAVANFNRNLGINKAQEAAMLAGATSGWTSPAADPASYDEQGKPIKSRRADRGDAR